MKKSVSVAVAGLILVARAQAETANKGWSAVVAKWSSETSPAPVVRDVGMQGPWTRVEEPDPPTNGIFRAGYLYRKGSAVSMQRVYMLVPNADGTIKTDEVWTTPLRLLEKEVITDYYSAEFTTEKVSFIEGDVFVIVLKADGQTTPLFLKIIYHRFVPS